MCSDYLLAYKIKSKYVLAWHSRPFHNLARIKVFSFTFSIPFSSCHLDLFAILRTYSTLLYMVVVLHSVYWRRHLPSRYAPKLASQNDPWNPALIAPSPWSSPSLLPRRLGPFTRLHFSNPCMWLVGRSVHCVVIQGLGTRYLTLVFSQSPPSPFPLATALKSFLLETSSPKLFHPYIIILGEAPFWCEGCINDPGQQTGTDSGSKCVSKAMGWNEASCSWKHGVGEAP